MTEHVATAFRDLAPIRFAYDPGTAPWISEQNENWEAIQVKAKELAELVDDFRRNSTRPGVHRHPFIELLDDLIVDYAYPAFEELNEHL